MPFVTEMTGVSSLRRL